MAIIATLAALGVGALISSRGSSQADAVADELVSTIRNAQSNSIAIKDGGCSGSEGSTKLWGVKINDTNNQNNFGLVYVCGTGDVGGTTTVEKSSSTQLSPYPSNVTINTNGGVENSVYFSSPFGQGYTFNGSLNTATPWQFSGHVQQDWTPNGTTPYTSSFTIRVQAGNYYHDVTIQPNGDVYD
jgi:Tfp pilus assembly protein FimT